MVYYPYMASIVGKKRGNATYYYLVESARVNGQPRIVSQEYLGTAEELAGAMRGAGLGLPGRTQHKHFGAVAAAWGMLEDLGVAAIIDEVTRARRSDAGASTGTYLALAALGRLVAPCSKLAFADWWAGTAAGRFTRMGTPALDHRRFWDAMHAAGLEELEEISRRIALAIVDASGVDCTSVALDMTNFATFIDTGNERAPIAQRGKAKQKRTDLRLAGLGLGVTRDGGLPLTWHAYPGDKPDVTQFPAIIDVVAARHAAICAASGQEPAEMTVVFDAGQNSGATFAHLAATRLPYVESVPASDCAGPPQLRRAARKRGPGFPRPRLAQGGESAGHSGRPPPPRQAPPARPEGRSRDRQDPASPLGAPGHRLAAGRRPPQSPPPHLAHRP